MNIAFRVDASATIGFGHLMRCLVLADAFVQSGMECHFFSKFDSEDVRKTIEKRKCILHPVTQEHSAIDELTKLSPDWVVFDGYEFDREYEERWTPTGAKVLVIDDLANRDHKCDILVDPTPGRDGEYASFADGAVVLAGANYALLDRRFARVSEDALARRKLKQQVKRLLVTLGGGNMVSQLGVIAEALEQVELPKQIEILVLSRQDVRPRFAGLPNVVFIDHSDDMPELLLQADICIGAAGGTSWERCCLGLPTVVLQVADNQKENFRALGQSGAAIPVPIEADRIAEAIVTLLSSKSLRAEMAENAAAICDGRGLERVFRQLVRHSLVVREATIGDARFIYDARYEEVDPENYRTGSVPNYLDHVTWLKRELERPSRKFLVVELSGTAVAHIRFDFAEEDFNKAEIGIALAYNARGKGFGVAILETACWYFFDNGGREVTAEVSLGNRASRKIFDAAGFALSDDGTEGFSRLVLQSGQNNSAQN